MFVACSTLCFAREPLEKALRQILELEFDKFELAIVEDGQHLRPSEVGEDPEAALQRLRSGPSLTPSSLHLDFGPVDWSDPVHRRRFENLCRFAKLLGVAVITMHAEPLGTPIDQELKRLSSLSAHAMRSGLVLAMLTHSDTLTGDPQVALQLCKSIPGLGLTLDPSHFLQGSTRRPTSTPSIRMCRTSTCATRARTRASSRSASDRAGSSMRVSSPSSSGSAITDRSRSPSSTGWRIRSTARSRSAS